MVIGLTRQLFPAGTTVTDAVTSVTDGQVVLGSNARANALGTTYYGAFFENSTGKTATGLYVGTGGTPFAVTGLGWDPSGNTLIVVVPGNDEACRFHAPTHADDEGQSFEGLTGTSSFVSMDADGFTVTAALNSSGVTYYWFAIKETAGLFEGISYLGDGNDDRTLTGAGFEPDFAVTKTSTGGALEAVLRFSANVGDQSAEVSVDPFTTNMIQDFTADGVEVGSDTHVNGSSGTWAYSGLFFKSMADVFEQATWTGTGAARSIPLSINPAFGIIKGGGNTAIAWITYPPAGAEEEVEQSRLMIADTTTLDVPEVEAPGVIEIALSGLMGKLAGETSAEHVRNALALYPGHPVRVLLCCRGGHIDEALAIAQLIRDWPHPTECYVMYAASSAAYVAFACDTIVMEPDGRWFVHQPYALKLDGSPAPTTPRVQAELDEAIEQQVRLFAERTGRPADFWKNVADHDRSIGPHEAVALSLADGVLPQNSGVWKVSQAWRDRAPE